MINEGYENSMNSDDSDGDSDEESLSVNDKNVSTQTDSSPITIHSWQIQRVSERFFPALASSEESRKHISLLPDGTQVYILETRNVGFNASTQTPNDDIFRRSKTEIHEIVMSWRVLTILFPSFLYLIFYFLDQLFDIIVCSEFCKNGENWWCGIGLFFLFGPSFLISIFAYDQLATPDIASIKPMNITLGRVLCLLQITPYYVMGRRLWWSLQAWSWDEHRNETYRASSQELWQKAAQESDSKTVKMLQSLLESIPQLCLQSYVLLKKVRDKQMFEEEGPTITLWTSVFVNLLSASSGMASYQSQSLFEKFAGSIAIFTTLGSRAIICGDVGTVHPAFWLLPVFASFLIGFVTKVSESRETTFSGRFQKFQKYAFEAFIMASACPPFDMTGFFCSSVYLLAAIDFFLESPGNFTHIFSLVLATVGQVVWILVGFCLMSKPSNEVKTHRRRTEPV